MLWLAVLWNAREVHGSNGDEHGHGLSLAQQDRAMLQSDLIRLVSSDPSLNKPEQWRPRVHWMLVAECVVLNAIHEFRMQDSPIDIYLESPPHGVYLLNYIQRAAQHFQHLAPMPLPSPKNMAAPDSTRGPSPTLSSYETAVFRHLLQALFYQGVMRIPEPFQTDRQLGALWLVQELYYTDVPRGLLRQCDVFGQKHNVRFARVLANRQDLHFQWFMPSSTRLHGARHEVIPPEKECACSVLGTTDNAAEVCEAMHCVSILNCGSAHQQRICVHDADPAIELTGFVCTCGGKHGFAADLLANAV